MYIHIYSNIFIMHSCTNTYINVPKYIFISLCVCIYTYVCVYPEKHAYSDIFSHPTHSLHTGGNGATGDNSFDDAG